MSCHMNTARLLLATALISTAQAQDYDIVVYGGTASAVIAAVQAKKMGKSVIVVSPDKHLGDWRAVGWVSRTRGTRQ